MKELRFYTVNFQIPAEIHTHTIVDRRLKADDWVDLDRDGGYFNTNNIPKETQTTILKWMGVEAKIAFFSGDRYNGAYIDVISVDFGSPKGAKLEDVRRFLFKTDVEKAINQSMILDQEPDFRGPEPENILPFDFMLNIEQKITLTEEDKKWD